MRAIQIDKLGEDSLVSNRPTVCGRNTSVVVDVIVVASTSPTPLDSVIVTDVDGPSEIVDVSGADVDEILSVALVASDGRVVVAVLSGGLVASAVPRRVQTGAPVVLVEVGSVVRAKLLD
jgi:hypothetical protein